MDILIVILLIILIIKDIKIKPKKQIESIKIIDKEEENKIKEIQEEFDSIMSYSIEDAIKEKRGE